MGSCFLRPFVLLPALLIFHACADDSGEAPREPSADVIEGDAIAPPPEMSRLRAEGTSIVDEDGTPVPLRGLNLGAWMFHETWITLFDYSVQSRVYALGVEMGIEDEVTAALQVVGPLVAAGMVPIWGSLEDPDESGWVVAFGAALEAEIGAENASAFMAQLDGYLPTIYSDTDLPMRDKLEARFGWEGRDELQDVFMEAWIREDDIAWIAAQGFSLVRIGMSWRTLTTGPGTEEPTELTWNEAVLQRLDQVLDWCRTHGLYAVLDIQEAPGGQNAYTHERGRLYDSPEMQALTIEMWEMLSARYRDRNEVAAYSLLAEPMSAPSAEARDEMYDRLIKAVRAQEDDRLIILHDGFLGGGPASFPDPADYGWENVIYSTHVFEWNVSNLAQLELLLLVYEQQFAEVQEQTGVPFYLGSFSPIWDEEWAYEGAERIVEWCEREGYPWSLWTYKRIDDPHDEIVWGDTSAWGVVSRLEGDWDRPDAFRDDLDTLRVKIAEYATIPLAVNERLLEALTVFRR